MSRMNMAGRVSVVVLAAVLLLPMSAEAALVISIGSVTIPAGGTGSVDVMIQATSGTDNLEAFAAEFVITTGGGTVLEFVNPPIDSHLSNANYVFASTGSAAITTPPASAIGPATTNVIADFSDALGLGVSGPFNLLLATLNFTTLTGTPPVAGNTFTVSISPLPTSQFFDNTFTEVGFTSSSGTITIGPAAAIPEPSSLVLAGVLVLGAGVGGVRRWRRGQQDSSAASGDVEPV
jgi:hypothetical protein